MSGTSIIAKFSMSLNTLKRVIGTIRATYDYAHWFFYLLLQHGVTALPTLFTFSCLYLSVCLSICLSVCVCVCACVCVCVSLCLSVCLSVCLSIYVSVCLCVSVIVCLSVRVSVCMSLCIMYICMLSLLS